MDHNVSNRCGKSKKDLVSQLPPQWAPDDRQDIAKAAIVIVDELAAGHNVFIRDNNITIQTTVGF